MMSMRTLAMRATGVFLSPANDKGGGAAGAVVDPAAEPAADPVDAADDDAGDDDSGDDDSDAGGDDAGDDESGEDSEDDDSEEDAEGDDDDSGEDDEEDIEVADEPAEAPETPEQKAEREASEAKLRDPKSFLERQAAGANVWVDNQVNTLIEEFRAEHGYTPSAEAIFGWRKQYSQQAAEHINQMELKYRQFVDAEPAQIKYATDAKLPEDLRGPAVKEFRRLVLEQDGFEVATDPKMLERIFKEAVGNVVMQQYQRGGKAGKGPGKAKAGGKALERGPGSNDSGGGVYAGLNGSQRKALDGLVKFNRQHDPNFKIRDAAHARSMLNAMDEG